MKLKNYKRRNGYTRGMTYVELIVVLSIFALMSSIMMFNYGAFQAKVDIRNLASDLALKIVQAQKYSVSGELPSLAQQAIAKQPWRPSYGVYLDRSYPKRFIFFTDLYQDGQCDSSCSTFASGGDFVEGVNINNNNSISRMIAYNSTNSECSSDVSKLYVTFKRPSSEARFIVEPISGCSVDGIDHVKITVTSGGSDAASSSVTVYKSGRIQVN